MKMFLGQLVTVGHSVEIQPPCLESIYPRMSKQRMRDIRSRPLDLAALADSAFSVSEQMHVCTSSHVCVWVCSLLLL